MDSRNFCEKYPVAWEGLQIAFWLFLVCIAALYFKSKIIFYIFFALAILVLFFFRNPERNVPSGENFILSPADGTIIGIEKVREEKFLKADTIKISVFLSIFNVHINRSPVSGVIKYFEYKKGEFLIASKKDATERNEKNIIGIAGKNFNILVYQVTGLIARRVVFWKKTGENVSSGERIGLMKFGSRMDVFCPLNTDLKIKVGNKVKAGETILGIVR